MSEIETNIRKGHRGPFGMGREDLEYSTPKGLPLKYEWGPGPWDREPDRKEWTDRGYKCLAIRTVYGSWNGYVGVGLGHPWYKVGFKDAKFIEVHGGMATSWFNSLGVCHKGVTIPTWWLGFKCSNWDTDYQPISMGTDEERAKYKTLDFVENECASVVTQAISALEGYTPPTDVVAELGDSRKLKLEGLIALATSIVPGDWSVVEREDKNDQALKLKADIKSINFAALNTILERTGPELKIANKSLGNLASRLQATDVDLVCTVDGDKWTIHIEVDNVDLERGNSD